MREFWRNHVTARPSTLILSAPSHSCRQGCDDLGDCNHTVEKTDEVVAQQELAHVMQRVPGADVPEPEETGPDGTDWPDGATPDLEAANAALREVVLASQE